MFSHNILVAFFAFLQLFVSLYIMHISTCMCLCDMEICLEDLFGFNIKNKQKMSLGSLGFPSVCHKSPLQLEFYFRGEDEEPGRVCGE